MRNSISILTYSTLFPNSVQTRLGIFVEERLTHLMRNFPVRSHVVAPVPWFPFQASAFGDYARVARVPRECTRTGIQVYHPRYPVLPRVSWRFSPLLMYAATVGLVRNLHATYRFDVIDAHFFYPDGVAATMLGRALAIPVVITARGSDISQMPQYALPRRFIKQAAAHADALVAVCTALKTTLIELGVDSNKIEVLRNGVDLEKFRPVDSPALRERLALNGRKMLLSVGNLVELKGNHLTLQALQKIPELVLVLVGDGPEEASLRRLAQDLAVADRVHFVGSVPQAELSAYYSAADALILASSREGWANVLLEAMACGTPALATNVWGTPEVMREPTAGVLLDERSVDAIVRGWYKLCAQSPNRARTREYAAKFGWQETSRGQFELFNRLLARRGLNERAPHRAEHGP